MILTHELLSESRGTADEREGGQAVGRKFDARPPEPELRNLLIGWFTPKRPLKLLFLPSQRRVSTFCSLESSHSPWDWRLYLHILERQQGDL